MILLLLSSYLSPASFSWCLGLMGQSIDSPYIVDGEEAFFHLPVAAGQKLVQWAYLHRVLCLVTFAELHLDFSEGFLLNEISGLN